MFIVVERGGRRDRHIASSMVRFPGVRERHAPFPPLSVQRKQKGRAFLAARGERIVLSPRVYRHTCRRPSVAAHLRAPHVWRGRGRARRGVGGRGRAVG